MNRLKKIPLLLTLICLCSTAAQAEEAQEKILNFSSDKQITRTEIDNIKVQDNTMQIEVSKMIGNTSTVVYTGNVNGYENGLLQNINFNEIDMLIIFDWDSESNEIIFIKTISGQDISSTTGLNSANVCYNTKNTNTDLLTVSNDISVSSQIKINGVNVGENGLRIIDNANMNCNFSVTNNSTSEKNVTVLLATYSQTGALVNVETFSTDVAGEDSENISFVYNFDAETEHSARLMFWDSISGMEPIKASVNFSQTSGINAYYYNSDNRLLQIDKANGTSLLYTYDNMGNQLTKTVRK